jgi:hypothetical protein
MVFDVKKLVDIVKDEMKLIGGDALKAAAVYIEKQAPTLKKWTKQYQNGEITKDELEVLCRGLKNNAQIAGLKEVLIAQKKGEEWAEEMLVKLLKITLTFIIGLL